MGNRGWLHPPSGERPRHPRGPGALRCDLAQRVVQRRRDYRRSPRPYVPPILAHTTRALQLLFQTAAEVDTLEELARVGTVAVERYEADDALLRELTQAIEARAMAIREELRLFPAPPVDVQPDGELEPAPLELVREWCAQVRTMGLDELNAIDELTQQHWQRASLGDLRWAIQQRRRDLAQ